MQDLNPWWVTSKVQGEYSKFEKRHLFYDMSKYLSNKQIIVLTGLRRTGKTVGLHHLIESLLRNYPKENILYYSFDLLDDKIENILVQYKEKVKIDIKKERVFVFLDEIQKHHDWENELKLLYDNFSNIKFIISGSASLFIEKKTKESLAGRTYSFVMEPLTFKEYLELRKVKIDKDRKTFRALSKNRRFSRIDGRTG